MNIFADSQCVKYPFANPNLSFETPVTCFNNDIIKNINPKNLNMGCIGVNKTEIDMINDSLLEEKRNLLEWSTKLLSPQYQQQTQPQKLAITKDTNDVKTSESQSLAIYQPSTKIRQDNKQSDNDTQQLYLLLLSKYQEINQQRLSLVDGIEETKSQLEIANNTIQRLTLELKLLKEQQAMQTESYEGSFKKNALLKEHLAEACQKIDEYENERYQLEEQLNNANEEISVLQNDKFMPLAGDGYSDMTYSDSIHELQMYLGELDSEIKKTFNLEHYTPIEDEIKINHPCLSHLDSISGNCITNHVKLIANAMQQYQTALNERVAQGKYKKQLKYKELEIKKAVNAAEVANGKYQRIKNLYYTRYQASMRDIGIYKYMTSLNEILYSTKAFGAMKFKTGFIMLNSQGQICWGKTSKVKCGSFNLNDIIRIDYGKSSAFSALVHNPPLDKWRCFSITYRQSYTEYSIVNFVATSDQAVANWVIGLLGLCNAGKGITKGSFYRNMATMKIEAYARKNKKSVIQVWKDAIEKSKR